MPTSPLIFGFHCPLCGAMHLLSSLGVKPIVEDVDDPLEPSLVMHDPCEELISDDGEVIGMTELVAVCEFCQGSFTIDLMVTPHEEGEAEQQKPYLTLVPPPEPD